MTPYEMRQKAYRNRTQANVLEESAHALRSAASSIRGLLSGVVGISRMVWQGPAATQFEEEAAAQSRNLDQQVDEIWGEAAGFDQKAAGLRSEANCLITQAARIEEARRAAAAAPANTF